MFIFYFNRKSQWCEVYLEEVHPNTFNRKNGSRWGYYESKTVREKMGVFGEIHLVSSRVRPDTVEHEIHHLWFDWMRESGRDLSGRTEEKSVRMYDEMMKHFWNEYERNK